MPSLGVVTIGHAPRSDFDEVFEQLKHSGWEIRQKGLLNFIDSPEQVAPDSNTKTVYVSSGTDGSQVEISKEKAVPFLAEICSSLSDECDEVLLACTGDFTGYGEFEKVLTAGGLLQGLLLSRESKSLVVFTPRADQYPEAKTKWADFYAGDQISNIVQSPYDVNADWESIADDVSMKVCDLVILDCMGYRPSHAEKLSQNSSAVVVCPQLAVVEYFMSRRDTENGRFSTRC